MARRDIRERSLTGRVGGLEGPVTTVVSSSKELFINTSTYFFVVSSRLGNSLQPAEGPEVLNRTT